MTGADVKRQVMDVVESLEANGHGSGPTTLDEYREAFWPLYGAARNLAPCIVLTAEEADDIAELLNTLPATEHLVRALALLTPDQEDYGDLPHDPPLNEMGC